MRRATETKAIAQLLDLVDVVGSVVTIDAMGTQRTIAEKIVAGGGEYVPALKGNQGTLKDECRKRKDHSPENFAIVRHIALNLLKKEKTCKRSIAGKPLRAGWDEGYLQKVVSLISSPNAFALGLDDA